MGIALGSKLTISGATAAMAVGVDLPRPAGRPPEGVRRLPGRGRRHRRLLVPPEPDPRREPAALDPAHRADRPARAQPRAGGPRRLHGRPLHPLQPEHEPLARLLPQSDREPARAALVPDPRRRRGGAVLAIWRPRSPAVRLAGAVTIVAAIAYLFTPLTAAGPEGHPLAFGINLRYLTPGLALGLALLPLEPRLVPGRLRLPLLVGGLIALFLTSHYSDANVAWKGALRLDPLGGADRDRLDRRPGRAGAAGSAPGAAGRAGGRGARRWRSPRWDGRSRTTTSPTATAAPRTSASSSMTRSAGRSRPRTCASASRAPAAPTTSTASTATTSPTTSSTSAATCPEADFRRSRAAREFRRAVNDGDYDYLVTTPELDLNNPVERRAPRRSGAGCRAIRPSRRWCTRAGSRSSGSTAALDPMAAARGADRRGATGQPGGSLVEQEVSGTRRLHPRRDRPGGRRPLDGDRRQDRTARGPPRLDRDARPAGRCGSRHRHPRGPRGAARALRPARRESCWWRPR